MYRIALSRHCILSHVASHRNASPLHRVASPSPLLLPSPSPSHRIASHRIIPRAIPSQSTPYPTPPNTTPVPCYPAFHLILPHPITSHTILSHSSHHISPHPIPSHPHGIPSCGRAARKRERQEYAVAKVRCGDPRSLQRARGGSIAIAASARWEYSHCSEREVAV